MGHATCKMCGGDLVLWSVSSLMTVVWGKGGTLPVECVVGVYFFWTVSSLITVVLGKGDTLPV